MKKIISIAFVSFFFVFSSAVYGAVSWRNLIREKKESGSSPAEIRREIREEVREQNKGILDQIKNQMKNVRFAAKVKGALTAINGNVLTLAADDGKNYTVNITSDTKLRRRFWGKSELKEFSISDQLNVIGKWADEGKTTIEAKLIRNLSLQKRWGVFFGKVIKKETDNFVIETLQRGEQTVYFEGAKLVNRKEETISYDDIQVGHKIRVKGVWDRQLNKIIEVDQVKDFSLPPLPTITKTH